MDKTVDPLPAQSSTPQPADPGISLLNDLNDTHRIEADINGIDDDHLQIRVCPLTYLRDYYAPHIRIAPNVHYLVTNPEY